MWPIAAILAVPLIEIALFVTVGSWLGLWMTLGIVIGTGVAGTMVIRWQGLHAMDGLRKATELRRNPFGQMADSALLGFSGVMLILPGFLTDTLGLLLLMPFVRRLILAALAARITVGTSGPDMRRRGADVIDGEYFEIEQDQTPDDHPGQARH